MDTSLVDLGRKDDMLQFSSDCFQCLRDRRSELFFWERRRKRFGGPRRKREGKQISWESLPDSLGDCRPT